MKQFPVTPKTYGSVDKITATYNGNQIATMRDDAADVLLESSLDMASGSWSGSDFAYDRNGNQTRDLSRGVSDIRYNELNLPARVEMDGGGSIEYLYSATGTKLAEIASGHGIFSETRRDYVGVFEYEQGDIKRIALSSGYVTVADTTLHIYIPDYQGNIVAVYNTATGRQERYHDYYPYGMPHVAISSSSTTTPTFPGLSGGSTSGSGSIIISPGTPPSITLTETTDDRRRFSAKELTTNHALNTYDFAARVMAPAFPRFTAVDRFAEKYYATSPYVYTAGDPINYTDITGDTIQTNAFNSNGDWVTYNYDPVQQNFIDSNGNAYGGKDENVLALLETLNQIGTGSNGKKVLGYLSDSTKNIDIKIKPQKGNHEYGLDDENTVSTVIWDPEAKSYYGGNKLTGLAHELLGHAYDRIKGTIDESIWISTEMYSSFSKDITHAEKFAIHMENIIRAEQGYSLRKRYGYPDSGGISNVLDQNNRSIYFDINGNHLNNYMPVKAANRYIYKIQKSVIP